MFAVRSALFGNSGQALDTPSPQVLPASAEGPLMWSQEVLDARGLFATLRRSQRTVAQLG